MKRIFTQTVVLIATLVAAFAILPAQAADAKEVKLEGAIVSRDGNNVLMRSATGNATVVVNEATEIKRTKGLIGLRSDEMTVDALIPGLSISVEADASSGQNVAKVIKFDADDFQRATEIQAALAVPQKEAEALKAKVKAQEQVIAAQEQQIEANKQNIDVTKQQTDAQKQELDAAKAAVDKRFSEMADYDVKDQMTVQFDVNSATLSEQAKADLQAFAVKTKTYKGYLVQVAGYTDSTGSASLNQNLSDRRAETVANYLRQACDLGMSRVLSPVAMSDAKPVAGNETAQGKAENRRVVVKVAVNRAISGQ